MTTTLSACVQPSARLHPRQQLPALEHKRAALPAWNTARRPLPGQEDCDGGQVGEGSVWASDLRL